MLLEGLTRTFKIDVEVLLKPKTGFEVLETPKHKIFLANGVPMFAKSDDSLFPTLTFNEMSSRLPKVTVDLGAIPYLCNGADVMAPGVRGIQGDFTKGELVLVVDEKYGKPIAISQALYDSESVKTLKQGKILKNLHYVGDEVWNAIKNLGDTAKVET